MYPAQYTPSGQRVRTGKISEASGYVESERIILSPRRVVACEESIIFETDIKGDWRRTMVFKI